MAAHYTCRACLRAISECNEACPCVAAGVCEQCETDAAPSQELSLGQWLDELAPVDLQTCTWCLGADGWWEDYTVRPEDDYRPDQGLPCGLNAYVMWVPCPRCSAEEQPELEPLHAFVNVIIRPGPWTKWIIEDQNDQAD